jgi:hypothetical protein
MPSKNIPYDPVPPYDLEDIEASASTGPSQPQQPVDTSSNENESGNVVDLHKEMPGRLTQRECCNYGLAYFITAVVGLIIIVAIIVKRR